MVSRVLAPTIMRPGILAQVAPEVTTGLTLLGREVRQIGSAFSVNSTERVVPWATLVSLKGTALIDPMDDGQFIVPTGGLYAKMSARIRVSSFDENYVNINVRVNGVRQMFSQLYGQGWHPVQITWAGPVAAGDVLLFRTVTDDSTLQPVINGRQCWCSVEVYA